MTKSEFNQLERGDIVVHVGSGRSYVVVGDCGFPVGKIVVKMLVINNPSEWKKVARPGEEYP